MGNNLKIARFLLYVEVVVIVLVIIWGFTSPVAFAKPVEIIQHEQYARAAMVYYVDEYDDVVTFIDGCGFLWAINGISDWEHGDFAALLMDNNGTAGTIADDIVLGAWYSSLR